MALTPLHSLRVGVGECNGVCRRSFRGTWERTPPDPTGLAVGAERRTGLTFTVEASSAHWVRRPERSSV